MFVEKGWSASTASIAKAAGISEGTIFKRFGSKEALFKRALLIEPAWSDQLQELVGTNTVRENLKMMCEKQLAFFRDMLPRITPLLACHMSPKEVFGNNTVPPPVRAIRGMAAYLAGEQQMGRLGSRNAEVLSRMLLGALHGFAFAEFAELNGMLSVDEHEFLDGLVDDPLNLRQPDNSGRLPLLLGSFVDVEIEGFDIHDVFELDRAWVAEGNRVYVMDEEDHLSVRDLGVVWRGPDSIFARDGLAAGDRIITSPLGVPIDGMLLRTADSEPVAEESEGDGEQAEIDEPTLPEDGATN
ncbi:MAG: TetR family transcriptional regulator [Myxococcales bacterium]|nr:TetR family transcriptional regulator [Myxococcales bacterium]